MKRNKKLYALLIVLIIILGLLSRTKITPAIIYPYLGDYFYAIMFFAIIGFLLPKKSSLFVMIISLSFCYSIETLQLYYAEWITTIRSYKIGALILGHGFLWSDIVIYTLGGITAYLFERNYYSKTQI